MHTQPISYHWQRITAVSVGANSLRVEIVQTLTQTSWDNTYSLFFTFTSWFHLAATLSTWHEKPISQIGHDTEKTLSCQRGLEAELRFARLPSGVHILADTDQCGSVSRRAFWHPQRACPRHVFSATCHKKIYQNLCTKAVFPFTSRQIKKPLQARITSGMSPFVGDGFMCPFPTRSDSCFYSLTTTTA